MSRIYVPTRSAEDWQRLLADPDLHWKAGYSAITLAKAWEAAGDHGFPPEVRRTLATSDQQGVEELRLLLAIPEYEVPLPGGRRPSQTDLMVIARGLSGLVVIGVEGKVDESLGPTVGEKRNKRSRGVDERLAYLQAMLELPDCPDHVRYQLLHRSVSALIVAQEFGAEVAVMLVHSFSPTGKWFADFQAFAHLFGKSPEPDRLLPLGDRAGIALHIGWCAGDQRFRSDDDRNGERDGTP